MKPTDRNKQLYRDMTEEPEKYSDQELEAMMDEIDQMPDVEEAWHLLSEKLRVKNQRSLALYTLHSSFKKVAAILISIISSYPRLLCKDWYADIIQRILILRTYSSYCSYVRSKI